MLGNTGSDFLKYTFLPTYIHIKNPITDIPKCQFVVVKLSLGRRIAVN